MRIVCEDVSLGRELIAAWMVVKSACLSDAETMIVPLGQWMLEAWHCWREVLRCCCWVAAECVQRGWMASKKKTE